MRPPRQIGRPTVATTHATDGAAEQVSSRDGTRIGFTTQGSGPGLVLVQGAMGTAQDYRELARALSGDFTVHATDRRGRASSPRPYDDGHDVARDVEDVDAVLAATGSSLVFGLSSGAVITLEAARTLPRITAAAVYEPPFYPEGISRDDLARLHAQIERGDLASALLTSLRTAGTAPTPIRVLPTALTRLLAAGVLALDAGRPSAHVTLRELVPGIRYDFHVVAAMDGRMDTLATLDKPVLLVGGRARARPSWDGPCASSSTSCPAPSAWSCTGSPTPARGTATAAGAQTAWPPRCASSSPARGELPRR